MLSPLIRSSDAILKMKIHATFMPSLSAVAYNNGTKMVLINVWLQWLYLHITALFISIKFRKISSVLNIFCRHFTFPIFLIFNISLMAALEMPYYFESSIKYYLHICTFKREMTHPERKHALLKSDAYTRDVYPNLTKKWHI